MTSSTYTLTEAELRELTGAVRKARQVEWLLARGIRSEIGADGKVKVLRQAVEAVMLSARASTRSPRGPNLAALKKAS